MQDAMKPQKQTDLHQYGNQLLENGLRTLFRTPQNSVSLLTAQTSVRDKYQKKKTQKETKNPTNVAYHTQTYANVRKRPPNWTYANIRNYDYDKA